MRLFSFFQRNKHSEQSRSDGTGAGVPPTPQQIAPVPHYLIRFGRVCCFITVVCWVVIGAQIGTKVVANLSHFHRENGVFPHD